MSRILAIDYGTKRTGLAVTDSLGMIASPLDVVSTHKLEAFLTNYLQKEDVSKVVIGMPKRLNGADTNATGLVRDFVKRICKLFPRMEVILHDERFTSKMALDAMIMGGTKKKERRKKGSIDKISATIILQSYLAGVS